MKKRIYAMLLVLAMAFLLGACQRKIPDNRVFSGADLPGAHVGVLVNTAAHSYMYREPNITLTVYQEEDAMLADLKNGTLDCVVMGAESAEKFAKRSGRIMMLEEPLLQERYSIAIAKENADLTADINRALAALQEDEVLQNVIDGYVGQSEYRYERPKNQGVPAATITLAVDPDFSPFAYYNAVGEITGLDIDVVTAVCDWLNLKVELVVAEQEELQDMVQKGKATLAVGRQVDPVIPASASDTEMDSVTLAGLIAENAITFTPKEKFKAAEDDSTIVDFSDSYYTSCQMLIVRKR